MTDKLTKPTSSNEVDNLRQKQIKLPGISNRVHAYQEKVKNADANADTLPNRIALILDCSGSMSDEPIKLLHQAIEAYANACNFSDTSVPIGYSDLRFSYSLIGKNNKNRPLSCNRLLIITSGSLLEADGNTPMGEALESAISELSLTRAVLVSDGLPDDSDHALRACDPYIELKTPIDCVHIGQGAGAELLQKIASKTGGIFMKFKDIHTFTQSFAYLTPSKRALLVGKTEDEVKRLTGADDVK